MGYETDHAATPGQKKLSPEYLAFMRSDAWRAIRAEAIRLCGRRCAGCMASASIHMHHLFYPRVLADTRATHILPLCERCHDQTHSQRLFHPTVFDESLCGEKRRQTIMYLQGIESARYQRGHKLREQRERRSTYRGREKEKADIAKSIAGWRPYREWKKKSHIFMTHAEYLTRMPAPQ